MIFFLKKIALKLPKPIRIILQKPWNAWCSYIKWDEKMIDSIADYFKISKKDVKFLLKSGGRLSTFFWDYLRLKNSQEIFYKITPFYIFDLAFWHMKKYQRIFHSKIIDLSRGKVLDFGGGIGDLSLALAQKGFSVTYADVRGETFNFAKYLFSKNNLRVKMIDLSEEKIKDEYDTIICIDVIEHLENQKETLDLFIRHLNKDGILIITNLDFNKMDRRQHEGHPMHVPINFNAKKYLLDNGLTESKYPWEFIKK